MVSGDRAQHGRELTLRGRLLGSAARHTAGRAGCAFATRRQDRWPSGARLCRHLDRALSTVEFPSKTSTKTGGAPVRHLPLTPARSVILRMRRKRHCSAKARKGTLCQCNAIQTNRGARRCRLHDGGGKSPVDTKHARCPLIPQLAGQKVPPRSESGPTADIHQSSYLGPRRTASWPSPNATLCTFS
jgi:hypothetical protein